MLTGAGLPLRTSPACSTFASRYTAWPNPARPPSVPISSSCLQARRLYVVSVAMGSVCLAGVALTFGWMAAAVRASLRERRAW